jgi:uncharacterized membrane protein
LLTVAAVAVAMVTPLVREAHGLALLPDPIEAYIRPLPSRSNFALFPWAGFLFAGAVVGELISATRERLLHPYLALVGVVGAALAYGASFLPSIYAVSNFWTSSPTFFFIRLGICTALVALTWFATERLRVPARVRASAGVPGLLETLGRSSLFVYWIHVEMVYGVLGRPLRRALPLDGSITATLLLCLVLFGLVLYKDRLMAGAKLPGPLSVLAPVLK